MGQTPSGEKTTLTMDLQTYRQLVGYVESYQTAVDEDGEANEAANNLGDLLVEYRRRGGLRWR